MPGLEKLNLPDAFSSHLKPDEQLKHWAFGSNQSIGLLLFIAVLMFVFMLILYFSLFPQIRLDLPGGEFKFMVALFVTGSITFIIAIPFLRRAEKTYIIGLTDNRVIIIHVKAGLFKSIRNARQVDFTEYPLQNLPPIKIALGGLKSSIKINDPLKPFSAKFPNLIKGNRQQIEAIKTILEV